MMAAFASGWNGIVRKKTLEDNQYNLRRVVDIPGTGPFKSKRRVENEVWVMEKNAELLEQGPALSRRHRVLPRPAVLARAGLGDPVSNRVDYARICDPVTARKAKEAKGMSATQFNQSVIQGTWMNSKKKPLDDPRVRRALHLSLDRPVLIDVVKDVTPMRVGGFLYPFSDVATPIDQLKKRLGYQDDTTAALKEAKALMAAAGYGSGIKQPLDFMVREVASFKLWAQAIQAMLQQGLGIETKLRTVVESVWFDDIKSGNYDLAIGAVVSTLLDPSDYFNAWYKKDGPQNYGFWDNKTVQRAVAADRQRGRRQEAPRPDPQGRGRDGAGSAGAAGRRGRRSTTSGTTT